MANKDLPKEKRTHFRIRGYVLRRDHNKKIQREMIVEDVFSETEIWPEEAIEIVKKRMAEKWDLVTETGVKWFDKQKKEQPGFVYEAE